MSARLRELEGKTCIVTGAGSGLGAAAASLFVEAGGRVIAVDRSFPHDAGAFAETVEADVADAAVPLALAARLDRVDVVACFAGLSLGGKLDQLTEADWQRVLSVNLLGTVWWITPFIDRMRAAGGGSVITVASQLAVAGGRGNPSYIASKGAIVALTRCLALDYAADRIRVNCIAPGAVETPMLERSFARAKDPAQARKTSLARHPLGRFGRPEEVAETALFLASDRSSFTTGTLMPVDGGWLA